MHARPMLLAAAGLISTAFAASKEPARETPDFPGYPSGVSYECEASAVSVLQSAPTPAPEMWDYLVSLRITAIDCQVTSSLPSSLSLEWSSFVSAAADWRTSDSAIIEAVPSSCASGDTSMQTAVQTLMSMGMSVRGLDCPTVTPVTTGVSQTANTTPTTTTGSSSSSITAAPVSITSDNVQSTPKSASGSTSKAAAPRATAPIASALAAAGFMGAVAVL